MDAELFQSLALVLLAVIAILLGAVAALLARVRRAVEHTRWADRDAASLDSQRTAPSQGLDPQSAVVSTQGQGLGAQTEAATATPAATVASGMRPLDRTSSQTSAEPEPQEVAGSRSSSVFTEERTASAPGAEDEPQEQPFERDGRWWFRRGDELLVYDEQTGQWLPAPAATVTASIAQSVQGSAGTASVATETRTASVQDLQAGSELSGQASSEPSGGFWKCPSCGAVNGSTATSCRMCFSARPS
jgi:hypothetical protein